MIYNSVIHSQFSKWIQLKWKKRHPFQTLFAASNFKNNPPKNKGQSNMLMIYCASSCGCNKVNSFPGVGLWLNCWKSQTERSYYFHEFEDNCFNESHPPPPALLILSSWYNYGVKHNLKQAGKYAVTTVLVHVFILVWVSTHRQMEVLKQAEDLSRTAYSSQSNRTKYARLQEITETEKQQE